MDKKKVVAAVGDEEALFLIGNHTNHESDEMETDETRIETQNNDTVTCKSDDRDDENVVFSKESSPLVSKSTLLSTDSGAIKFEKCSQEKKLSRQDRIELGRLFQGAVSSHDWELAESLISLADPQTLNDALCISLDSIWFLSTHHELDGITALIKTIISNGASDFTRAALRTSFLASCVSACQSRTMSLADTVSVMAKRLHERLQECNGDEVLKAEAGAKVQKFTEWALKCIGFHSRCQGNKDRVNQNSAAQVQLQLSAFKTFLDLAGNHLTGKDFTEAFDAACFPLTLFSSSFDPGWASGMSATAIQGLLAMLVEGGADNVNQCFLEASRFGSTELVRILLQIAQRNSLDVDVDLALGFASHYSKISTMECLVEEGNAMAFLGPLMRAAERGCMQVVQWFVKRGCRDMELCLALTAATSSSQVDIAAYLLPHVPQHVLAALSIEILKAAGERSGGSLEGVAFLLQSNFLGDPAATYAVADSISRSDDDSVAPELREFLQEEWSEAAFFAGVSSGEVHYFNFVSISKWGESPISLMDLPGPLRVAIAYLPLYRECVKAGGCLLSQQLRGRLVEAVKRLGGVVMERMPMLRVADFKGGTPEMVQVCYAILVLVLPGGNFRSWTNSELEILKTVADQVAVALSHAAVLEESRLMRDKLVAQNQALQQAKHDAMRASQARRSFQSVMSTGLRKPMHSIMGLLSILQDDNLNDEQRVIIDTMVKNSNVLSILINDVMDDSTKDNGKFPLEMTSFRLHDLVKEAACLAKCLCAYKDNKFEVNFDKYLPHNVLGDERRIFQVILHMVGNLLSWGNGGGCLTFRVFGERGSQSQQWRSWRSKSNDGYVNVKFEIGINDAVSVVERSSGDLRSQRVVAEESLSFTMCKKLVQMMQGNIWVVPNPIEFDQSMSLVLRFQLRPSIMLAGSETSEPSDHHHPLSNSILKGVQVLLADEDDINRAVTSKLLKKLGCVVTTVTNGLNCLTALTPPVAAYQILILDLHLSDLDGFEVASRIRKFRSRNWPLIIASTACGDEDLWERCLEFGMNGILRKPIRMQDIADQLRRVLIQANKVS